jgi:hypothetical protein
LGRIPERTFEKGGAALLALSLWVADAESTKEGSTSNTRVRELGHRDLYVIRDQTAQIEALDAVNEKR